MGKVKSGNEGRPGNITGHASRWQFPQFDERDVLSIFLFQPKSGEPIVIGVASCIFQKGEVFTEEWMVDFIFSPKSDAISVVFLYSFKKRVIAQVFRVVCIPSNEQDFCFFRVLSLIWFGLKNGPQFPFELAIRDCLLYPATQGMTTAIQEVRDFFGADSRLV